MGLDELDQSRKQEAPLSLFRKQMRVKQEEVSIPSFMERVAAEYKLLLEDPTRGRIDTLGPIRSLEETKENVKPAFRRKRNIKVSPAETSGSLTLPPNNGSSERLLPRLLVSDYVEVSLGVQPPLSKEGAVYLHRAQQKNQEKKEQDSAKFATVASYLRKIYRQSPALSDEKVIQYVQKKFNAKLRKMVIDLNPPSPHKLIYSGSKALRALILAFDVNSETHFRTYVETKLSAVLQEAANKQTEADRDGSSVYPSRSDRYQQIKNRRDARRTTSSSPISSEMDYRASSEEVQTPPEA